MYVRLQREDLFGPSLDIPDGGPMDQAPATDVVTFDETWGQFRVQHSRCPGL
jgi:hypothetical protein